MGDINDEIDDKVQSRIQLMRHKELLGAIKGIKLQPPDDSELKALIHSAQMNNEIFIKKVNELQKQELPKNEINVQTDHSDIVKGLNAVADRVEASNNKLMDKLDEMITESKREKKFDMKIKRRDVSGIADSVNGTIK